MTLTGAWVCDSPELKFFSWIWKKKECFVLSKQKLLLDFSFSFAHIFLFSVQMKANASLSYLRFLSW